ncbi:hypothetical protein TPA0909_55180 [Streptomyces albus]|nr:hypothetical protein TPA0909_55180 [Streptomyces albus]
MGPYAVCVQAGGGAFGAVAQPAEGEGAVVGGVLGGLDEHGVVGGEPGAPVDQFPQGCARRRRARAAASGRCARAVIAVPSLLLTLRQVVREA